MSWATAISVPKNTHHIAPAHDACTLKPSLEIRHSVEAINTTLENTEASVPPADTQVHYQLQDSVGHEHSSSSRIPEETNHPVAQEDTTTAQPSVSRTEDSNLASVFACSDEYVSLDSSSPGKVFMCVVLK